MVSLSVGPKKIKDAVNEIFKSSENITYLHYEIDKMQLSKDENKYIKDNLAKDILSFSQNMSNEVMATDPTIQSIKNTRSVSVWNEVRVMNRNFLKLVLNNLEYYRKKSKQKIHYDPEQFELRMFMADSMYPNGYEHFNSHAPLYGFEEEQRRVKVMDASQPSSVARTFYEHFDDHKVIKKKGFEVPLDDITFTQPKCNTEKNFTLYESGVDKKKKMDAFAIHQPAAIAEAKSFRFNKIYPWNYFHRGYGYETDITDTLGLHAKEIGNIDRALPRDRLLHPEKFKTYIGANNTSFKINLY